MEGSLRASDRVSHGEDANSAGLYLSREFEAFHQLVLQLSEAQFMPVPCLPEAI